MLCIRVCSARVSGGVCAGVCLHVSVNTCALLLYPQDPGPPPPRGPWTPASALLLPSGPPVYGGRTLAACTQGTTPRGCSSKCELKCRRLSLARLVFHTRTCSPCQSPGALRSSPRLPSAWLHRLRTPSIGSFTSWDLGRFRPKAGTGEAGGLSPFAQEAALAALCVFCSSGC